MSLMKQDLQTIRNLNNSRMTDANVSLYYSLLPRVHFTQLNDAPESFHINGWSTALDTIRALNSTAIQRNLVHQPIFICTPRISIVEDELLTQPANQCLELEGYEPTNPRISAYAFHSATYAISEVMRALTVQPFKTSGHLGELAYVNGLRNEFGSRLAFAQFPQASDTLGVPAMLGQLCMVFRPLGAMEVEVHISLDNGERRVIIFSSRCQQPRFTASALTLPLRTQGGASSLWKVVWVDLPRITAEAFDTDTAVHGATHAAAAVSSTTETDGVSGCMQAVHVLRALVDDRGHSGQARAPSPNRWPLVRAPPVEHEEPHTRSSPSCMARTERILLHGRCRVHRLFLTDRVRRHEELPRALQMSPCLEW